MPENEAEMKKVSVSEAFLRKYPKIRPTKTFVSFDQTCAMPRRQSAEHIKP